ncbi:hypothetical protein [Gordonia aquimaris]|jgi:hypothetical protein|uniref:Uncharacterized protein n=1 Tax=Gordonia aquimaris TaxID=2984863 RepID=A0A9X3D9F6_9ACTN|nr:hypothetical protein [Gordonia aquimaris]MCX2967221.1 hypothetical protein [Gordonia aquimaris]
MGKTKSEVREVHVAVASDIALRALELTGGELDIEAAQSLEEMKALISALEVTTTQLLLSGGNSWSEIALQLGAVKRQSLHRRLNRRISKLLSSDPGRVPVSLDREFYFADAIYAQNLQKIERLVADTSRHGYHPSLVKHRRPDC